MVLLADPTGAHAKLACECFASVYPRVFLHVSQDLSPMSRHLWQIVCAIKERITFTIDNGALGARIGAAKACQRWIQVQSTPDGDPRVRTACLTPAPKPCRDQLKCDSTRTSVPPGA